MVDDNARMDIGVLRTKLQECLDAKRAVYAVVAVIGSTEEGAVDPLDKILELRDEFLHKGLSFIVHADAAWGGYYASMLREPLKMPRMPEMPEMPRVPRMPLVRNQNEEVNLSHC